MAGTQVAFGYLQHSPRQLQWALMMEYKIIFNGLYGYVCIICVLPMVFKVLYKQKKNVSGLWGHSVHGKYYLPLGFVMNADLFCNFKSLIACV